MVTRDGAVTEVPIAGAEGSPDDARVTAYT
jgi:hypothetical protein